MRRARPKNSAPCVAGTAESLPFDDSSFDAVMAILSVHHWRDYRAGLRELRRVARRRVLVVHWDQAVMDRLWLADYFPEAFAFDRRRGPSLQEVLAALDLSLDVVPLLVPHDCQDGFGGAYWRRPDAYLDPTVRAGISMLAQTEHERGDGLERLQRDLNDGTWATRHRALLDQAEFDCGYRIAVGLAEAHAVWQALLVWRFPGAAGRPRTGTLRPSPCLQRSILGKASCQNSWRTAGSVSRVSSWRR
jgi:SAM-dependent methyltransferase